MQPAAALGTSRPYMVDLWTRRTILTLAAGAGATRLLAFSSDFWNKKEPSEWTHEEIQQITSKSPWAKEVTASAAAEGGGMGQRGGMGGGGGWGGGGMGGGRHGGGGRPGAGAQSFKGTVRWESAKPIVDALKNEIPKEFADHYVISVSGFPLGGGGRRQQQSQDEDGSQSSQDTLDRLKQVTFLEPKGRRDAQPGIVKQPVSGSYGTVWFGFNKDFLNLKAEDKEASFTTQFGRLTIKVKYNLKDMLYRGELAV
jgi:hypothetical protein